MSLWPNLQQILYAIPDGAFIYWHRGRYCEVLSKSHKDADFAKDYTVLDILIDEQGYMHCHTMSICVEG